MNRIQLLAEQSDNDIQVNEARRQLAELSSEKINNEEVNFERNDAVYYSLAFELHHYFDTRAVVHMALGDAAVANMIDNAIRQDVLAALARDLSQYHDLQMRLGGVQQILVGTQ